MKLDTAGNKNKHHHRAILSKRITYPMPDVSSNAASNATLNSTISYAFDNTHQLDVEGLYIEGSDLDTLDEKELNAAIQGFSELSEQLNVSYSKLENKARWLNEQLQEHHEELETVKQERLAELVEKENLAEKLEHLLYMLPAGVVVLDRAGKVQQANPAVYQILNTDKDILGNDWKNVVSHYFQPQLDDGCEVSLKNGKKISIETQAIYQEKFAGLDESQIYDGCVNAALLKVKDKTKNTLPNKLNAQLILLSDLSETRNLQEAVNRKSRLSELGKLIASLSHQIRTPLSAALLYCSQLKQKNISEHQQHKLVNKVMDRLKNMEVQIANMLQFTAIGNHCVEALSLHHFLTDLKYEVDNLHFEDDIKIKFDSEIDVSFASLEEQELIDGDELKMMANPISLQTACINLVENSIHSCQKMQKGTANIKVYCRLAGKGLFDLIVEDNGPGLAPGARQKLGEDFYTSKIHGNGLGLQVVKAVATAHGGKMLFASQPNRYTRFVVRLPLLLNVHLDEGGHKEEPNSMIFQGRGGFNGGNISGQNLSDKNQSPFSAG